MKKILAIAAVAALTAGVSAYAANPFSDVSTSDWAYQAVSQLSDQGIVEGYPDGTFRGQRNITRYELAQIIARLMANEDQFNAEQRATIDKLAGEYADELDNLGVRVSNLEAKVGNISWSGDARMKWDQSYDKTDLGNANDNFNGRMRINAHAQVNDSTYVEGLLRSKMDFKSDADGDNNVDMQRLYVHHDFGSHVGVNVGKYAEFFGQTGMFFDSDLKGAELTYTANDAFSLTAGYGRFNDWNKANGLASTATANAEYGYAQINGAAGRFAYSLDYIKGNDDSKVEVYGGGLTIGLTDKFDVFGDYFKNSDAQGDPDAWTAGLGYGHQDDARVGSFRVSVARVDAEQHAVLGGYPYDVSALAALKAAKSVKFWNAAADVTVAKNVRLHGEYDWNVDTKGTTNDYDDLATVSLNYVF